MPYCEHMAYVAYSADLLVALTKSDISPAAGQNKMKVAVIVWRSGCWMTQPGLQNK